MVKTSPSDAWGMVSVPGHGAKIQYASPPKKKKKFLKPKQNIKQKQYCDKFNANFKKMVHVKKKSKKENIRGRCTEAGSKGVEK